MANATLNRLSLTSLSMKAKIICVVSVPLVLTFIIGIVASINLNRLSYTQAWVDHTRYVLNEAATAVAAAVDMETGMRGYLLAGSDSFLEPYQGGEAAAYDTLSRLQETVNDNPPQVARLQEAEAVLRQWQSEVAQVQIDLRTEIGDALTMNDVADVVRRQEGMVVFDRFRGLIAEFIDAETVLLDRRTEDLNRTLATGLATSANIADSVQWVEHTYRVIATAEQIVSAAVDMETGMRGFLLAGDDAFLEPLDAGWERFQALTTALSETVSDNPAQVERLASVQTAISDWHTDIVLPMLELRRGVGTAATMDDLVDLVSAELGKVYFDAFRTLMAEFVDIEQSLMEQRQATAQQTRTATMQMIIGTVALSVLLGGLFAWRTGNTIGAAIRQLTTSMQQLAGGDTTTEVSGQERRDEVGEMARALGVFRDALHEKERVEAQRASEADQRQKDAEQREIMDNISKRLSKLSTGDLTVVINEDFPPEYQQLRADFNATVVNLSDAVGKVVEVAGSIKNGADEITSASDDLATRTERQAATLQESAAALEQLTSSVKASANGARNAEKTTSEARKRVEDSSAIVEKTVEAMNAIANSSDEISRIVVVIDEIAFQTNLLALNAGVEAARAGDAGRGFAVVASEVRGLAQRCSQSATSIKSLISGSSEEVKRGVDLVGKTGTALEDVVNRVNHISELMAEIASASKEQSSGLEEINLGVVELDRVAQQNTAMVEEATAACHLLNADAAALTKSVSQFQLLGRNTGPIAVTDHVAAVGEARRYA